MNVPLFTLLPLPLRGCQVSYGRDSVALGPEPVEEFGIQWKVSTLSCIQKLLFSMNFKTDSKYKMSFCKLGVESVSKDRDWDWVEK